jgi:hypothetical protein
MTDGFVIGQTVLPTATPAIRITPKRRWLSITMRNHARIAKVQKIGLTTTVKNMAHPTMIAIGHNYGKDY